MTSTLDRLLLLRADEQMRAERIGEVRGYHQAHKQRCRGCDIGLVATWSKSRLCALCRNKAWARVAYQKVKAAR